MLGSNLCSVYFQCTSYLSLQNQVANKIIINLSKRLRISFFFVSMVLSDSDTIKVPSRKERWITVSCYDL